VIPLVMGVLNVTPDSFSDGGQWLDPDAAISHGLDMVAQGASVVDVGGESTRPGAEPVDAGEEIRRVVPVIEALAPHVRISIDTRKAAVAEAAVHAGATLLNDVSASLFEQAAALGVGWVAMHMQGTPETMQIAPAYHDVVSEVAAFLEQRAEQAAAAGVSEIWLDPGFGFGKNLRHNLLLLKHLDRITAIGPPVVAGLSRKATTGRLIAASDQRTPPTDEIAPVTVRDRQEATIALEVWAMRSGIDMIRSHEVLTAIQAAKVVAA
jgi:dihydropteroate synthase